MVLKPTKTQGESLRRLYPEYEEEQQKRLMRLPVIDIQPVQSKRG